MVHDDAGQIVDQSQDFAWCSLDPVFNCLVPYPERQTHHLESAFRAGRQHVTILVPAQEIGLISAVTFNDPEPGSHTQRTITGAGERRVVRIIFGSKAIFPGGLEFDVPLSAFTRFGRVAWISVEPVDGVLQPYASCRCCWLIDSAEHC